MRMKDVSELEGQFAREREREREGGGMRKTEV